MFVTQLPVAVPPELLVARKGLPEEEKDHQTYGQRQEITDRLKHVRVLCQGTGGIPRAKASWAGCHEKNPDNRSL